MKKVYLTIAGFCFLCRVNAYAQARDNALLAKPKFNINAPVSQDTDYVPRKLSVEEINLVSSYYDQTGNHSAITGGIGTQNVNDISNGLDVKMAWQGSRFLKNSLTLGLGFDHHTSASSAYVTLNGQGKKDGTRIYPSLDWTSENTITGNTFGIGTYYSGEYNYKSFGVDLHFSLKTRDKSGEFSAKLQAYLDHVTLIYPAELVTELSPPAPAGATYITTASGNRVLSTSGGKSSSSDLATSPRNTYTASFGWSQVINSRLNIAILADVVTQDGLLSLPYHRVYLSNGKDTIERLPSTRLKLPVGFRLNYFAGDRFIFRTYYRYYTDSWNSQSNTASLEVAYKINPFFSLSPFYRFYTQTAAKYFAPYGTNPANAQYFTSNYEYAAFNSNFYGAGLRISPPKGVAGWQSLHELEIRYGHYTQTTGLASNVISVSLGFK